MAPTFKKSKDCSSPAALACITSSSPPGRDTATARAERDERQQLLISLGLAEEGETVLSKASAAKMMPQAQPEVTLNGHIGAFYPSGTEVAGTKVAPPSAFDVLRGRLEATTSKLLQGQLDDAARAEVQELLLDQQHQIDLLLRGQSSLRGSMNNLRRSAADKDAKAKQVQQQLKDNHGAALKDMEAKLGKAIHQVQQLQHTTRERQQQQTGSLQQSLQCASQEAGQLRAVANELQAALSGKEQELIQAQQVQESLAAQLLQEQQAVEAQRASFSTQLQELAADCQAALAEVQAKAVALATAQAELQQLAAQLEEASAAQQDLTALNEQLKDQVQRTSAAAQQQHAEDAAQKEALAASLEKAQAELQQATAAQQHSAQQAEKLQQHCQELEQRCHGATEQLEKSQAEVRDLQAKLSAASKLQKTLSDKASDLQQDLVAAVQAQTDLQLQLEQARANTRELQVKHQQAEAAVSALQQQHVSDAAETVSTMQAQQTLQEQVKQLEAQHDNSERQLQALQAELADARGKLQEAEQKVQDDEAKLTSAETDSQQLHWKLAALQTELQKVQRSSADTIKRLRQEAEEARQQLSTVQEAADQRVTQAQVKAELQVDVFRQRWQDEFDKRRKLHNQVIELKGNIRVLARIRPMIEKERSSSAACSDAGNVEAAVRMVDTETLLLEAATHREYEFDRVFGPTDGQLQVYQEISGLVISTLDGFCCSILAYGQTGSGKTYTIEGPVDDPGLNSRALADLFKVADERKAEMSYTMSASVLEIYNETIFDLLAGSKDTGEKLDIKEGPTGLFIPGLRIESVCGPEDVATVLQKGKQNRSTFATNMNEHSSRSHLVLTIYVTAKHLAKDTTWSSKLHLIDLAGSERVSRSGAEGDRLKEAAAINKSLSALGDVVAALQQRNSHVPYRNSKLTRLLEDSLGGSSKTLLVVNCSPAAENVGETKCSLDFATRARKVELGPAVRVPEWSSGGLCSSPSSSGRDSPVTSSSGKASQVSSGGATGGSSSSTGGPGSAASSPRVGGRYSGGSSNELRQSITRRAAATSHKEEK